MRYAHNLYNQDGYSTMWDNQMQNKSKVFE